MTMHTRARGAHLVEFSLAETWLGNVAVAGSGTGLCAVELGEDRDDLIQQLRQRFPKRLLVQSYGLLPWTNAIKRRLDGRDAGIEFPYQLEGTAFQKSVWEALRQIPMGRTRTYNELAAQIGRPDAVRAVANACAANPLAIIIPCHRVIRSDGDLGGYRWGLERKRQLLQREQECAELAAAAHNKVEQVEFA